MVCLLIKPENATMPHKRLRRLREGRSFVTQKAFCSYAQRTGIKLSARRYGGIERGDITPDINDIIKICSAMKISADAWLFGVATRVDVRELSAEEIELVEQIVKGLAAIKR
jgi:transcriptional regulator with XRE-family HTH domain